MRWTSGPSVLKPIACSEPTRSAVTAVIDVKAARIPCSVLNASASLSKSTVDKIRSIAPAETRVSPSRGLASPSATIRARKTSAPSRCVSSSGAYCSGRTTTGPSSSVDRCTRRAAKSPSAARGWTSSQ